MQKIKDYVKAHPGVTGVIGTGLVAAAGYYGGAASCESRRGVVAVALHDAWVVLTSP